MLLTDPNRLNQQSLTHFYFKNAKISYHWLSADFAVGNSQKINL